MGYIKIKEDKDYGNACLRRAEQAEADNARLLTALRDLVNCRDYKAATHEMRNALQLLADIDRADHIKQERP